MTATSVARPSTTMDRERETTSSAAAESRALASRPAGETQIIRSPREFTERLQVWQQQHYHVLTPFANFSALPAHLGIVPTLVKLDNDPSPKGSGHVYQDNVFTKGNDVAIAKIGLSMIAQAAGMSIRTVRTDDRRIPNFWEVKATVRFIGLDGTPQDIDGHDEYDLRDGAARLARNMTQAQITQARVKGLRGCESRAINAAIRQFGVKQKYTREELLKPFVVLRIIYMPDLSDPLTRARMEERAMLGTTALYGAAAAPPGAEQPLDVIGVDPVAAARQVIDVRQNDAPPARPVRHVKSVTHDLEAGLYDVTFTDGTTAITRATELANACLDAKKKGHGVHATVDPESGEIREFDLAGEAPTTSASTSPDPSLRHIADVKPHTGKRADGSTWTRYDIIATTGESWSTFSSTAATTAEEAKTKGWPVRIADKENEKYPDQRDVVSLTLIDPRQPNLPGTEPAGGY